MILHNLLKCSKHKNSSSSNSKSNKNNPVRILQKCEMISCLADSLLLDLMKHLVLAGTSLLCTERLHHSSLPLIFSLSFGTMKSYIGAVALVHNHTMRL